MSRKYDLSPVLRDVSLRLFSGERLALTGPSGSGKTTLLNCLGGIDRPDSGSVLIGGEDLTRIDGEELAMLRRRKIGNVFQFFHLLPTLSVRENVEFPLLLLGVAPAQRRERAGSLLERVKMGHRAEALPSRLSGGEMQRCAIARALVHSPRVILADEPTGNLDSVNSANILELLQELSGEMETALVLVTHSEEAARICQREVRMRDGVLEEVRG
ncbi:MAG: putative ABC transport system ATP-binding protein [Verrucomicrobia bacterium]|nr:MAG: putative ABC transport system ATP-binding protein [Verrucomicrobiota bacterium]